MTGVASGNEEQRPEKIEVTVPAASLVVGHARCPNGHLLMAPDVPIGGHPSILVTAKYGDKEGKLYLDPRYGSFEHKSDLAIPEGAVVGFFCPECGETLREKDVICNTCSAPMFIMHLPHGGRIEGCTRCGCFSHRLAVVDMNEQLLRLFEETSMDSYL
jgi:hypothetical protein